ncbi:MAG: sugar transferase [Hyphomicrobiaceae bacterium]
MATVTTSSVRSVTIGHITRRVFDIVLAAVSLIALAPLMGLIALAIVLESGRPIFFSHTRLGLHGRPFRMFKFRKFHKTCSASGLQLTLDGDARMTSVGRLLRLTKLDELPQLWNVLLGDMSIIGPRPESTGYADCFKDGFEEILKYKPGILGPTQVKFRDEGALYPKTGDLDEFYRKVLFPAKARIDLDYYSDRTLLGDLGWLVQGILATIGVQKHTVSLKTSETREREPSRSNA